MSGYKRGYIMANKIAINYDTVSLFLPLLKTGTPQKSEIHNETKTVDARTVTFVMSNPRFAQSLPSTRKNNIFILSN